MSLLVLQHHSDLSPAALGATLRDHGHRLRVVDLSAGQPLPPDLDNIDGVVSLGGDALVTDASKHAWLDQEMAMLKEAHEAKIPIVGIGLGAQLIAQALGGEVGEMKDPEVGWHNVKLAFPGTIDAMMSGIPWDTTQFHMHKHEVTKLPPGGTPLSGSAACRTQAFSVGMHTYAFQYHFELTREAIDVATRQSVFRYAQQPIPEIAGQTEKNYALYRHLGDRLAARIALLLFPIDKKIAL